MTTTSIRTAVAACIAALLAGCATVPVGPAVPAYRGTQKTPEQFAVDDATCRGQAQAYVDPNYVQRSNDAAAANVVGGTLLGAAIGALFGSITGDAGPGAAIGAGFGALGGSAVAADRGAYSSAQLQAMYDRVYFDCMYARGHRVPAPAVGYRPYRGGYAPPPGATPAPADAPPPRGDPPPSMAPPAAGYPPRDAPPPR
jgi:hypothetical protein